MVDQLKKYAEHKQVSLNTLTNQVLNFYVNFTDSAEASMMPVFKVALVELLEGYSDDQIKAIAHRIHKKVGVDVAFQLRGRYDFEAILDIYEHLFRASGVSYRHTIDEDNQNRHTFIIQYNMGKKFSLYSAEFLKATFEPVSAKKPEYTITDNMVAITVEGKE